MPIASLTKMMTAYVVLRDHPLRPPGSGRTPGVRSPSRPADVAEFDDDAGSDESNVPVQVGEVLTERQLLEGLLIHSANNIAYTLAVWDAGSRAGLRGQDERHGVGARDDRHPLRRRQRLRPAVPRRRPTC